MTNSSLTPELHSPKITTFAVNQTSKSFGKYSAAVDGPRVISLILIPTIPDKDQFNAYRDKSREALAIVGEVITGEIQIRNDQKVFVKRIPRNNNVSVSSKSRIEPTFHLPTYLQ